MILELEPSVNQRIPASPTQIAEFCLGAELDPGEAEAVVVVAKARVERMILGEEEIDKN